jgi:SAM-dependent methyltransferase
LIVAVTNPKMSTTGGWDWDKALQEMPGRWTEVADELFSFSHEMHNCGCQSVFDLGCGAGRHSVFLAQQGFAVSASDISPSAIEKTRANLQQAGTDATLYQIDMTEWPFSDAQFDAVVAFNVVYHAHRAEVETILHQINRVLSPGGLLFITFKSTLDAQCGQGEQLAPLTWAQTSGIEKGIAHYYVDEAEARRLMQDFDLISMVHKQELPGSGKSERHRAHWVIWARKNFE